jgi:hypothetical protein
VGTSSRCRVPIWKCRLGAKERMRVDPWAMKASDGVLFSFHTGSTGLGRKLLVMNKREADEEIEVQG